MKISGKTKFRFTDLSNIQERPAKLPSEPIQFLNEIEELTPYLRASVSFWEYLLNPIIAGIQEAKDMTEPMAEYYKQGQLLLTQLHVIKDSTKKADDILEKIFFFWLKSQHPQTNNFLSQRILGSKSLILTYHEWLPQIILEFQNGLNTGEIIQLLAAKAFTNQNSWPIEERAALSHYLEMFTDLVQYYQLTHFKDAEKVERNFFNAQIDLELAAHTSLLN
ncbi:MAG: hypothetical protein H8E38_13050 [SAR324 cluster bacterium]|nr:hypothetical protein [SAR324 cluster bacterium]MBL7036047.1 hypothetical protein [SAR324 cluster bacterium]